MSTVWFMDLRASRKATFAMRLGKLLKATGLKEHVRKGDLTAVKLHFGEAGTTAFVQPLQLRPIVDFLTQAGAKPFLTDSNTLYVGQRGESVSHAALAWSHGFGQAVAGAPVLIADGLKGEHETEVPFAGKHIRSAFLAGVLAAADHAVIVSHFKGHELAGFGGALKNVAMGCASRKGKMHQHASIGPVVDVEKCAGCGQCVEVCAPGGLTLVDAPAGSKAGQVVAFDQSRCAGCAACFLACKTGALTVDWRTNVAEFLERMMEYAAAWAKTRKRPPLYVNFVQRVTPDCDCAGYSDAPLCADLGVAASWDPVALDQACLDMVNAAPPAFPSRLPMDHRPGANKFAALHPHVPEGYGLNHAVTLGLGTREYVVKKV